jgi:hypothetical protein
MTRLSCRTGSSSAFAKSSADGTRPDCPFVEKRPMFDQGEARSPAASVSQRDRAFPQFSNLSLVLSTIGRLDYADSGRCSCAPSCSMRSITPTSDCRGIRSAGRGSESFRAPARRGPCSSACGSGTDWPVHRSMNSPVWSRPSVTSLRAEPSARYPLKYAGTELAASGSARSTS